MSTILLWIMTAEKPESDDDSRTKRLVSSSIPLSRVLRRSALLNQLLMPVELMKMMNPPCIFAWRNCAIFLGFSLGNNDHTGIDSIKTFGHDVYVAVMIYSPSKSLFHSRLVDR